MKKLSLVMVMVVAILVVVGACATPAPAPTPAPAAPKLTLPADAQKLSDVIPQMGEHWANPSQLPLGPIYIVYKGELIAIEYMWTEDMMQELSIPTPEGPEELSVLGPLPVGVTIDHADVAFMHNGHEGFEVPHWDIHMYFITHEEHMAITPGG